MFCGYARPLVRAVVDGQARGHQFLLPIEDTIIVSEELGRRYRFPKWQYTLGHARRHEAIRVTPVATGRDRVLLFDGKYHGHFDPTLVELVAAGPSSPRSPACRLTSSSTRPSCLSTISRP